MNCKQCGAPLNVVKGQDLFHCEYCDSYNFPDPNLDGVALLDEISPYACPVCHRPLVTATVKDVRIHACTHCRGNLISQSKLLPILKQAQLADPTSEDLPRSLDSSEFARVLLCPACQKKMEAYPYAGPGNLIIQGCAACRLIWLDFGELSRIMRAHVQLYHQPPDGPNGKQQSVEF